MKRINSLIALILLLATLLSSCGTYTPPANDPDQNPGGEITDPGNTENPTDQPQEPTDLPYTVTLNVNGKAYTPNAANGPYYVQWSNGFSLHTAELIDGKAEIYGLDDDFKVTLLNVPSGYVYNPNAYIATADSRDVSIELMKPTRTSGNGPNSYDPISISKLGVYQATVQTGMHAIFYEFRPSESGEYVIESWVNVTENNINPSVDLYNGSSFGWNGFSKSIGDGGASSTYTKNFRFVFNVDDSEISATGGSVTRLFAIKATAKDSVYPINVTFSISRNGEFNYDSLNAELMIPTEKLEKTPNYSSVLYTLTGPEVNEGGNNIFREDMFKLWSKGTGMKMVSTSGDRGDSLSDVLSGSYQVTFVNPKTNRKIVRDITFTPTDELSGWVKIVEQDYKSNTTLTGEYTYKVCKDHKFANLNDKDCNLCGCERAADPKAITPPSISLTFQRGTRIDYAGFTIDEDGVIYYGTGDNFYHFYDEVNESWGEILYAYVSAPCRFIDLAFTEIEYQGNKNLTVNGGTQNYKFFIEGRKILSMGYFCVNNKENEVFCPCLDTCGGACAIGCPNCHVQCRQIPEEYLNATGYADFTNQDGVYGVTEELKDFLQKYSTAQLLFRDGNGHVETNPSIKVYSNEESQWLFACAYYEKN